MSEIRVTNILGENGNSPVNFTKGINMSGICTATAFIPSQGQLSHYNVLINGAMTVRQRGSTFSHIGSSNTNILTMDRWKVRRSSMEFDTTITHSTDSPDGFLNSLKITPDAVETPSASQNGLIEQQIEGQSLQHFAYGTSSAKSITASFYAKSGSQNNGHTYTLQLRKYDSSNNTRIVTKAFTVTSSWQRFTMTFAGDTSNNIKNSTDYTGFEFIFQLATGPDDLVAEQPTWTSTYTNWRGVTGNSNFMDNTNNEFYVTGCQLEVGSVATPFEHRSYADELQRCRRYYQVLVDQAGTSSQKSFAIACAYNGSSMHSTHLLSPEMRTVPSLDYTTGTNYYTAYGNGTSDAYDQIALVGNSHVNSVDLMVSSGLSVTQGNAVLCRTSNAASKIAFIAEI